MPGRKFLRTSFVAVALAAAVTASPLLKTNEDNEIGRKNSSTIGMVYNVSDVRLIKLNYVLMLNTSQINPSANLNWVPCFDEFSVRRFNLPVASKLIITVRKPSGSSRLR